jgi:hypothetical protein
MGWMTKADEEFVEKAADDTRRAQAIAGLSGVRIIWLCLMILCFAAGMTGWMLPGSVAATMLIVTMMFLAAFQFVAFSKSDSDLRLLKVIDRLRKEGRLPPEARAQASQPP